jgi:hypothetical protein
LQEHVAHRQRHCTVVDARSRGILTEHRYPERAPARRHESRQDLVQNTLEQIAQTDMDERPLGLSRSR